MKCQTMVLSKRICFIVSTFALCNLASPAWSRTYDVTVGADADCSDGTCSLQAALDTSEANNGESNTLRIAQGEYIGNFGYFPVDSNSGNLTVLGGWSADFSSRTIDPVNTILNGNNSGTAFSLKLEDLGAPTIIGGDLKIEGVTIKNGNAEMGGGLVAFTAAPSRIDITNCIIQDNKSDTSAGGCLVGVYDFESTDLTGELYIENNIISNNFGNMTPASSDGSGGGCLILVNGLAVLNNNLIYGNTIGNSTCTDADGGGLRLEIFAGDLYLTNNTITENQVTATADSNAAGGGVQFASSSSSAWAPGHVYLYNNIIYNNNVLTDQNFGNDIENSIDTEGALLGSSITVSYSNYGDLWTKPELGSVEPTLIDNITSNPELSTESSSLYSLTASSPCIDTGQNTAPYLSTTDLADNLRLWDGNADGVDTVDMGCYEYGSQKNNSSSDHGYLPAILMLLN